MFRRLTSFGSTGKRSSGKARLSALATKAASEGARAAVTAALAAAGSPIAGPFLGTITKEFVEMLLARTGAIEKKLDTLLSEPLLSGLQLLHEASVHEASSLDERESRDKLLDHAHLSFVRAYSIVADSRSDAVLVRSLDCLVLAPRTGRLSIAYDALNGIRGDMNELRTRVQAQEAEAQEWLADDFRIRAHLGRDDWGTKPFGYDALLGWNKIHSDAAKRRGQLAKEAREEFDGLEHFVRFAELAIKREDKAALR